MDQEGLELDLESPLQKVINLLRQLGEREGDAEFQEQIDVAAQFLSRSKLSELFLPQSLQVVDGQHTNSEELVQITQLVVNNHQANDSIDAGELLAPGVAGDRAALEKMREQVLRNASKVKFTTAALSTFAVAKPADAAASAPPDDRGAMRTFLSMGPEAALQDERLRTLERHMSSWDFNEHTIFGMADLLGPDLLFFMMEHACRQFGLFDALKIDAQKLYNLCGRIVAGYNDHPYHNWIHACDVLHGIFWLLSQKMSNVNESEGRFEASPAMRRTGAGVRTSKHREGGRDRHSFGQKHGARASVPLGRGRGESQPAHSRSSQELGRSMSGVIDVHRTSCRAQGHIWKAMSKNSIFAALLGAAFHDINHDGYNNAFHVSIASQLALTYNDKSVLENMHTSVGLSLMLHADSDVLDHLSTKARQEFRSLTVNMIMGTDLAVHFEQLAQFQMKIELGFQLQGDNNDLAVFLPNLLHAADLGSTARPPPLYYDWMQRVFQEFFRQGNEQKRRGLEVTPFMDRDTASITKAQQARSPMQPCVTLSPPRTNFVVNSPVPICPTARPPT
uniref:Phosphodiesterase n=1 Tax=Haptolina ericina TaxID=156174 RepID=A0A7S3FB91_9EUKA